MKNFTLLFISFTLVSLNFFAQEHGGELLEKSVPAVDLKDTQGKTVNTGEFDHDGPIIISFWATWCTPCKKELNAIHDEYIDWVDETNVKLIAVSIDDERTRSRVVPYVDGQGWDYEILLDPNSEFRRAMGVNNVPHTFVIDTNGKIVYSHNNYSPGDEIALYDFILSLNEEE
jgi:peroxiredoxin